MPLGVVMAGLGYGCRAGDTTFIPVPVSYPGIENYLALLK